MAGHCGYVYQGELRDCTKLVIVILSSSPDIGKSIWQEE